MVLKGDRTYRVKICCDGQVKPLDAQETAANRKSGGGGAPPQTSCNSKTTKFKRTETFVLQALSKHDELLLTVSVVF